MKTLIVGGTSSLGVALKPAFLKLGVVITAGRKNCDILLDLSDPVENMHIPEDIDVIIHTAAKFGKRTDAEILETETINALGTLKLCQLAVRANIKHFVYISSIYSCLDEKSEQFSAYALSKRHAEELARLYCSSYSQPLTIIRPSQIYGVQESLRKHQPFFYSLVDKAASGQDVVIYGKHDPRRNFIHIEDLTEIVLRVVLNKVEGTYSCMHPHDTTFSEIANAAFSAFNNKGTIRFLKDKADVPDNIFEKDESLYRQIGYYPQISIVDGMKSIARYYNKGV